MGFRYQELKDRGDSIELERRESFTTERSHNGYIKRKKTVVRERFQHPHAKEVRHHKKQKTPQSEVLTTQRQGAEPGRTTTETFGYSPGSQTIISHCCDKSHLERAVNRTSVQLKRLAHQIDHEIAKLKLERDKLMLRPYPHPLMRNAAIQNDLQCDDVLKTATTNAKLKDFNAVADNIEFTIEKFSSQHKFVCTSPRYARDEQTSCRPRMRTIGLQKDTQRNTTGVFSDSLQNLKVKLGTALQNSATNLDNLKATGLLDPAPPNCYAFDYGGTGDGQNALKVYHLQNCRYAGGCNPNVDCNCQKMCEHYNNIGNYNGMLCNKNTYVEKGVTPCSKYKYCRDEYHYDYPKTNSPCRPCTPCLTYQQNQQPCQPCVLPCLPPCPTYNESQPTKPRLQVIYGRRMSDLNTDEFYHPTGGSSPTKHSPTKHGSARRASTKERLTVDVPKDGRTSVDIERHGGRTQSKLRRKREDEEVIKQRGPKPYEAGLSAKTNVNRQMRERNSRRKSESSGSADSSEKFRNLKNKEKLLEITFTKERRRRASSGSGDECIPYEVQPDREYMREAKRSLKQMTITAYKPCKPAESEGESDGARKKKKTRKSKNKNADRKSEDDKTWDERLKRDEQEPRVDQPQDEEYERAGIPTIAKLYDNYRVGDAWEADEFNVAQQQYVGAYRESYQVSQRRSYDIMPVQKDTIRDIPPVHIPVRGRRLYREKQRDHNEEDVVNKSQAPYARSTAESIRQNGQLKTGKGYTYGVRPDSLSSYGVEDKVRPVGKPALSHDYETGRTYSPGDKSRPGVAIRQRNSYSPHESDKRYTAHSPSREDGESSNIPKSKTAYTRGEKPSSARGYDYRTQSDKKHIDESGLRPDFERSSHMTPGTIYALDRKPRSARDPSHADKKYLGEDSPSRAGYKLHKSTTGTVNNLEGKPDSAQETSLNITPKAEKRFIGDAGAPYPAYEFKPTMDAIYAPDAELRLARDHAHSVGPKDDKRYVGESSSRADYEPAKPTSSAVDTPVEKTLSAQDYDQSEGGKLHKKHIGDIYGSNYAQENLRSAQEKLLSPRDYDSGVQSIPARSHDTNTTSHQTSEPNGDIHSQEKRHQESPKGQESKVILTNGKLSPLAKQTSQKMEEKPASGRLQGDVSKGEYDGYAAIDWDGKSQIQEGYAEKVEIESSGEYIVSGKTDASSADMRIGEVEKISPLKIEKPETGSTGPPTIAVTKKTDSPSGSARTGRDLAYHGPEVPEIHIEDNDESGRSYKSGKEESARISLPERAKFAIQGEMVLEPQYGRDGNHPALAEASTKQGERAGSQGGKYRKPDTMGSAEQTGIPKSGTSNFIIESSERFRIANAFDESQQLSPFPSLESPRIYMRPRTTCPDYSTACLPPASDCTKKSNKRENCVENAGDVYMCKATAYNACQSSSPCSCLQLNRSCNEIPYEKLGDEYTHSAVRQLAANSHLAVALQPDAALGNYIPSPQPKTSKNCIYLRSTGTQYSATIIEKHEDRCAPQYIPLPKDCNTPLPKECSEMSFEEQKQAASTCCPHSCDAPCEDFQTVSCTPQNNYSFLCEEENEEYEDKSTKINLNNDQWCQRVEGTNSQNTQPFMGPQQTKENSPRLDCKNYSLPWQQDQKFIPGQPLGDCDVQDGGMQQRSRYQSLADRRLPRFNATMPPHQEMPEEEARCAEEMSMYKPQPHVQFMEQNLRQYESSHSCCHPQAEESKFRAESMEPMNGYERPGFNDCREFQQIPQFTGCPCMFKTYLNMVTLYYPDCRIQMLNGGADQEEGGCCNNDEE